MNSISQLLNDLRLQSKQQIKVHGRSSIKGNVHVQGSKNATNKLIATTIALPGEYIFHHFPLLLDPLELLEIVVYLGGSVRINNDGSAHINTLNVQNKYIPYSMTRTTTGAFGFAGALLGRFGTIHIGKPGGDAIGPRPVNLHIDAFKALGADVHETATEIEATLKPSLVHINHTLPMPSTGAAVNFILAAVGAGIPVSLTNGPFDGDMMAMYKFIEKVYTRYSIHNTTITLPSEQRNTHNKIIDFTCIPDRNDAFTWMAYGALSQEGLTINNAHIPDMQPAINVFNMLNIPISVRENSLYVTAPKSTVSLPKNAQVIAGLGTEFHSDWAPLLEVVLTQRKGECTVIDTLFSQRIRQAEILSEMGAKISMGGGTPPAGVTLHFQTDPADATYIIHTHGPTLLNPINTNVGYDVRACAAAVLAASIAQGSSVLSDIGALYRGYESIIHRLSSIGVSVQRM